jgi:aminoglycoside N3'-acetyltransferase
LLLGVGHRNNTSFHLGDYRAGYSPEDEIGAALLEKRQARLEGLPRHRLG